MHAWALLSRNRKLVNEPSVVDLPTQRMNGATARYQHPHFHARQLRECISCIVGTHHIIIPTAPDTTYDALGVVDDLLM